jgi:phosphoribosylglycinamide formyltransferase-1
MAYRVAILGSGRGSNARAILEAQRKGRLGYAEVVGILSDQPDAGILDHGREFGVDSRSISAAPYKTKLEGEAESIYIRQLQSWDVQLVVLAGFMRVIKSAFLKAYAGRIINLHPSLLPRFPGLESIRRAWESGETETGCTVHWVNDTVDGGDVIRQKRVPIEPGEELAALEERVHAAEHQLLPSVIADLSRAGS